MPNKDGTGPRGAGPKTGRQRGNCQGATPCGKHQGDGRGQGRNGGCRHRGGE